MTKAIMVIVVTASVPEFRRASEKFTNAGAAYPIDYFSDEQLDVLRGERKLSVQETDIEKVRDGVDISRVAELAPEGAEPEQPPPAKSAAKKPAPKATEDKAGS